VTADPRRGSGIGPAGDRDRLPDTPAALRVERLNFRHLHHFYEVARCGSLKAAAEVLDLSSATLSTQLRQLETWIGQPLLVRESRRGVRLTDVGRKAWRHAEKIFAEGEAMLETVGTSAGPSTAPLRLGLPPSLPCAFRGLVLDGIREFEPERRMDLVSAPSEILLESLRTGAIDVAVTDRPVDRAVDSVWSSAAIQNTGLAFIGERGRAAEIARDFPHTLDGIPLVLPTHRVAMRAHIDRWLRERSLSPRLVGEADDPRDQAALATANRALFAVPTLGLDSIVAGESLAIAGRTQAVRVSLRLAGGEKGLSRDRVALWSDRLRRRTAHLTNPDHAPAENAPGSSTRKEWMHEEDSRSDAA